LDYQPLLFYLFFVVNSWHIKEVSLLVKFTNFAQARKFLPD